MTSPSPVLLVVVGLQREAQIAAGDGVMTICSGGNPALLLERLHARASFETAATQPPQDEGGGAFAIRGILSFGLAGGLAPHLESGDIVVATSIVAGNASHEAHDAWHQFALSRLADTPRVHRGAIAGSNAVVAKSAHKAALHGDAGALAVDMESHIAATFARERGLPFMAIRAISDPVTRNLPDIASNALTADGDVALGKVIGGLMRRPSQLPALIAAGIDSERAFASLRRCRRLLGPLFGLGSAHL